MLKTSIYTHLFKRDSHCYLFNSRNSFFAEIPIELFDIIKNNDLDKLDNDDINDLTNKGIIVDSDSQYDFYNEEKIRYLTSLCDRDTLSLVLVPSTACNFACPYCFEEKKHPKIADKNFDEDLINFINDHIAAKQLSIIWYGGEPLLAFDRIKDIYHKITTESKLKITSHRMVTNGYLINDDIISFFKENELNHIQITLDGCRENHNRTRFLKHNKSGTYDIILNNIIRVSKELPSTSISVRVNINKENSDDFIFLHKYFEELKLSNVLVYPGLIEEPTPDGSSYCSRCITGEDTGIFYNSLKEKGCNFHTYPHYSSKGCMINRLNSYIIGPEGEIYKCWEDVSNEDKIIGYITEKEIRNKHLFYRYLNDTSAFSDEKCKDCKLFPVCSGGCGQQRYKNLYENGRFNVCHEYQKMEHLETALLNSIQNQ